MAGEWCGPHLYWSDYEESEEIWALRKLQVTEHLHKFEPNVIDAEAVEAF